MVPSAWWASVDGLGVRPPPPGLLEDLEVTGAYVECSGLDPMADLIRAQRLAVALAEAKGSTPTNPGTCTVSPAFLR